LYVTITISSIVGIMALLTCGLEVSALAEFYAIKVESTILTNCTLWLLIKIMASNQQH